MEGQNLYIAGNHFSGVTEQQVASSRTWAASCRAFLFLMNFGAAFSGGGAGSTSSFSTLDSPTLPETVQRYSMTGREFKIDPGTGERLGLLAIAPVDEGGWVDLPEPIIVRADEAFIAAPNPRRTAGLLLAVRGLFRRQLMLSSSWACMTSRSSLLGFFFCAYAFSWLCWLPVAADASGYIALPISKQFLRMLGQFGPFLAAILVTALQTGKPGLRELGRGMLRWRVHPIWFGVALCLAPASLLCAIGAQALVRGVTPEFKEVSLLYNVFINFFLILFWGGPLGEELGWRGLALPRLQAIQSPLVASIVLAMAWGGWHLPIFLMADAFTIPVFVLYVISTIPLTIVMTWLFNHTKGSVLLAILFHGSLNTFYIILPIEPAFSAWVILLWILALLIVTTERGWFARRRF